MDKTWHYDWALMLGLHYVPGGHGSPGSPKRSAPWTFNYILLHIQVLLRLATFSHGLSRYTCRALRGRVLLCPGGSKAHCGLAQIYHGRQYVPSRRVTFWWDPSRISRCDQGYETFFTFCQGFQRMKRGCQQHWSTLSTVVHMKLWYIMQILLSYV